MGDGMVEFAGLFLGDGVADDDFAGGYLVAGVVIELEGQDVGWTWFVEEFFMEMRHLSGGDDCEGEVIQMRFQDCVGFQ